MKTNSWVGKVLASAFPRRPAPRAEEPGAPETWFAHLEHPDEGGRVEDILLVAGWAFSATAPVVEVAASLDGSRSLPLAYGVPRPDVAQAFPGRAPLECGFLDRIPIDRGKPGASMLRIRILDGAGNLREIERTVVVAQRRIHLHLEQPTEGTISAGAVRVAGWAFSRSSWIVDVRAKLGSCAEASLCHGFASPSVQATFADPVAGRCAFRGTLAFVPVERERSERLVVEVTDFHGEVARVETDVRLVPPDEPRCEIESARWRDARLEVGGFVVWPGEASRRVARIHLAGVLVGETVVDRSRPDLRDRFPNVPARWRRGFRFSGRAPGRGEEGPVELVVEISDGNGARLKRAKRIVHEGRAPVAGDSLVDRVGEVVERVGETGRSPSVLVCQGNLLPEGAFPDCALFAPPSGEPRLPYLDGSVDVVVSDAGDPERLEEARRVAGMASIEVGGEPGRAPSPVTIAWRAGAPSRLSLPSVSIVIPVFDQASFTDACLKRVMETLPAKLDGEIIVVDDASTDETQEVLRRWASSFREIRVLTNARNLGFVDSCNAGAAAAMGEVLVFLNNDTLPRPGWLPPLLRCLRDAPGAGAVCGRLVYPDGTLQEAGGVIFSDGSGCNYGNRDPNPEAPLYSFRREVDYGSGALLAIRRSLFAGLGGFDVAFRPAYYEDVDLCFRVREAGYRVYYEPESTVVHFEGVSSGTDLSAGVKRHQVVNRETFSAKWAETLRSQPAPPAVMNLEALHALSVREAKPRALVMAPRMPEYDREGGSQRVFHLIELLQEAGWAVSFVADDATGGERYRRMLQRRGVATYAGPQSSWVGEEYLETIDPLLAAGGFDLALLAFWHIAEDLHPRIRSLSPKTRIVVDSIDLHFLRAARGALRRTSGSGNRGVLEHDYADRMVREMNAYAAADAVLTVSAKEADLVNDLTADPGLARCVPLLEDLDVSPVAVDGRRGLLFIGNFRHPPNVEALRFLCDEVLPRLDPAVLHAHPLSIVGNGLDDGIARWTRHLPNVRTVGWVPSLIPYLQRSRVSLIPLLHGAGTKTKLVQALMTGTPSVSTRIGVEGLGLEDRVHTWIADEGQAFADGIVRLVEDDDLWQGLARRGRAHAEKTHGRDAVRSAFLGVIGRVAGAR